LKHQMTNREKAGGDEEDIGKGEKIDDMRSRGRTEKQKKARSVNRKKDGDPCRVGWGWGNTETHS